MATIFKRGGKKAKGYYYVQWYDHQGKRRTRCTKTTDKATAERIAKQLESQTALRREGVIDPETDVVARESRRTIDEHLADFVAKMKAAGRDPKHIAITARYIRSIADFAGFRRIRDIQAEGVTRYASCLRDKGRSARTVQAYLTAIKSFTKWLAESRKLPHDPLMGLKKPSPKTDRRIERRMLLPEEWRWLKWATQRGPERYGMTPAERVLLYETAIQTGLRSKELRSLTPGLLFVDADPPYLMCKADATKNRKDAKQYVQPELAAALRDHVARKAPKAAVFNLPHESNLARMLRDDLAEARRLWAAEAIEDPQEYARRQESDFLAAENHEGESIDFHALRHTCGAWLAMTGVNPKVVQSVMRHSSITLTMDTYGHLFPGQEADAVERMRGMLGNSAEKPDTLAATGTDGAASPLDGYCSALQLAQQLGRETVRMPAKHCDEADDHKAQEKTPKPLQIQDLSVELRHNARACQSTPAGTRTPDPLIKSQLL
ncbi:MAG: hypothetical protein KatS3mg111_0295 [Pirellulaceae bacterium]|nr:MAG: hypothetical protein KatS3mg111_0295 [Pirellulaceae bacterium]